MSFTGAQPRGGEGTRTREVVIPGLPPFLVEAALAAAAEVQAQHPTLGIAEQTWQLLALLACLCMTTQQLVHDSTMEKMTDFYCSESDVVTLMRAVCWAMLGDKSDSPRKRFRRLGLYDKLGFDIIDSLRDAARALSDAGQIAVPLRFHLDGLEDEPLLLLVDELLCQIDMRNTVWLRDRLGKFVVVRRARVQPSFVFLLRPARFTVRHDKGDPAVAPDSTDEDAVEATVFGRPGQIVMEAPQWAIVAHAWQTETGDTHAAVLHRSRAPAKTSQAGPLGVRAVQVDHAFAAEVAVPLLEAYVTRATTHLARFVTTNKRHSVYAPHFFVQPRTVNPATDIAAPLYLSYMPMSEEARDLVEEEAIPCIAQLLPFVGTSVLVCDGTTDGLVEMQRSPDADSVQTRVYDLAGKGELSTPPFAYPLTEASMKWFVKTREPNPGDALLEAPLDSFTSTPRIALTLQSGVWNTPADAKKCFTKPVRIEAIPEGAVFETSVAREVLVILCNREVPGFRPLDWRHIRPSDLPDAEGTLLYSANMVYKNSVVFVLSKLEAIISDKPANPVARAGCEDVLSQCTRSEAYTDIVDEFGAAACALDPLVTLLAMDDIDEAGQTHGRHRLARDVVLASITVHPLKNCSGASFTAALSALDNTHGPQANPRCCVIASLPLSLEDTQELAARLQRRGNATDPSPDYSDEASTAEEKLLSNPLEYVRSEPPPVNWRVRATEGHVVLSVPAKYCSYAQAEAKMASLLKVWRAVWGSASNAVMTYPVYDAIVYHPLEMSRDTFIAQVQGIMERFGWIAFTDNAEALDKSYSAKKGGWFAGWVTVHLRTHHYLKAFAAEIMHAQLGADTFLSIPELLAPVQVQSTKSFATSLAQWSDKHELGVRQCGVSRWTADTPAQLQRAQNLLQDPNTWPHILFTRHPIPANTETKQLFDDISRRNRKIGRKLKQGEVTGDSERHRWYLHRAPPTSVFYPTVSDPKEDEKIKAEIDAMSRRQVLDDTTEKDTLPDILGDYLCMGDCATRSAMSLCLYDKTGAGCRRLFAVDSVLGFFQSAWYLQLDVDGALTGAQKEQTIELDDVVNHASIVPQICRPTKLRDYDAPLGQQLRCFQCEPLLQRCISAWATLTMRNAELRGSWFATRCPDHPRALLRIDDDVVKCQEEGCDVEYCRQCFDFHVNGEACAELQLDEGSRRCPRCFVPCTKDSVSECMHMVCAGCGTHFCYYCGAGIQERTWAGDISSHAHGGIFNNPPDYLRHLLSGVVPSLSDDALKKIREAVVLETTEERLEEMHHIVGAPVKAEVVENIRQILGVVVKEEALQRMRDMVRAHLTNEAIHEMGDVIGTRISDDASAKIREAIGDAVTEHTLRQIHDIMCAPITDTALEEIRAIIGRLINVETCGRISTIIGTPIQDEVTERVRAVVRTCITRVAIEEMRAIVGARITREAIAEMRCHFPLTRPVYDRAVARESLPAEVNFVERPKRSARNQGLFKVSRAGLLEMDLQRERNALLKYVLQHPPPNVAIALPARLGSIEDVDLTTCPLPLETYYRAETSGRAEKFTFDVASNITFRSEGRSLISRTTAANKSEAAGATGGASQAATKTQLANNAMTVVAGESGAAATAPVGGSSSSIGAGSTAPPLSAVEESPKATAALSASATTKPANGARDPTNAATLTNSTTSAPSTANGGTGLSSRFGFRLGSTLKAHHATESAHPAVTAASPSSTTTTTSAAGKASAPIRSLRSYLPAVLVGMGRTQGNKNSASASSEAKRMSECDDRSMSGSSLAPVRTWSFIPLNGTTPGTLRDTVASWLAAAPARRPLPFGPFPDLYNVSLCPLFDSTMLLAVMGESSHTTYEHLLMANALLLGADSRRVSQEIYNIYMPAFGLTTNDHMQCMFNLMSPTLRSAESRRQGLTPDEERQLRAAMQFNEVTLVRLITHSTDDEFTSRMSDLLHIIRTYRDEPSSKDDLTSNAPYPFVMRASLFASALVPLYRINPTTNRPYATPGSLDFTLAALKRLLNIPDELVDYCALHAHLYANEEVASDLKTQSSFLKGIARAVNTVVVHDGAALQSKDLTPEVKYCYYVLQETLSLAMTPMPWLETLWSGDALRSVSALFIEVCLSLPPCFLSVFVLVDGQPLLYPQWSSGTCLLELLSFFMTVSAFRRFGDLPPDRMPTGAPVAELLNGLRGIDDPQLAYAQMLSKSFPHALGLVCPLRMQFAMFALRRHWSVPPWHTGSDTCAVMGKALVSVPPPDLAASLNAMLAYLLDVTRGDPAWIRFTLASSNGNGNSNSNSMSAGTGAGTAVGGGASGGANGTGGGGGGDAAEGDEQSQTMAVLALNATHRLHALQPIVEQYDAMWMDKVRATLQTIMSKGGWAWERRTLAASSEPPAETKQFVQLAANIAEMPPPLGSSPAQIYTTRLNMLADLTGALVNSIVDGVPGVLVSTRPLVTPAGAGGAGVNASNSNNTSTNTGAGAGNNNNSNTNNASSNTNNSGGGDGSGATGMHSRSVSQVGGVMPLLTSGLLHPTGSWKPVALVECDRLLQYHTQYLEKDPPTGPTVPELVQRLATLHLLRQELSGVLLALQRQYERVARVTGAPAMDMKPMHESLRAMIREAERLLCEGLGAAVVLHPCFFTVLSTQLMRWDEKAYKSLKRKDREALAHYPLAFPEISLSNLLTDLNTRMLELLPLLPPGAAAEFRSQTGLLLVCLLYKTYLEGTNVFLTPQDAQPILTQLDALRNMFFPHFDDSSRGRLGGVGGGGGGGQDGGATANGGSGGAHQRTSSGGGGGTGARRRSGGAASGGVADTTGGEQRLNELCNVVRYVMSQPSSLLIGGGNGVPPLSSLPDRADNSPWCKYIVHRVLNHRKDKDAKKQSAERAGFWMT